MIKEEQDNKVQLKQESVARGSATSGAKKAIKL